MNKLNRTFALMTFMLVGHVAQAADWQINNDQSQLNFISTKKQNIAEIHHFGSLNGQLTEAGAFTLNIDLDSVDTGVEIRDTRMKELLFNVMDFPIAELTAQVEPTLINDLTVGQSVSAVIEGNLALHGQKKAMAFDTLITKVSETELLVVSAQPIILNVADYKLGKGVEELKQLAGLPSISHAVPVSFYLTLNAMK